MGLRTVFRHFEDMESLYAEIQARLQRLFQPLLAAPLVEGDLRERARAFVNRRAGAYERMAPFTRSDRLRRWNSPIPQQGYARMVRELRQDLRRVLPETRTAPEPVQQALELVTSFEAWDRLRSDQGLGRGRAEEATLAAVLALPDET